MHIWARVRRLRWGVPELALAALCLLVFVLGVRATGDLDWPGEVDLFRDIGSAQTVADGDLLGDPQYRGELLWYNPLTPDLVAGVAGVLRQPIPRIYTRLGAYLNLLAPILFFVLVAALFDRWVALAAVVLFLFGSPPGDSSLVFATYSAWLYAADFAQVWFYLTLLAFLVALRTGQRRWVVATGALLGATFLSHTAPALTLGMIMTATLIGLSVRAWRTPARWSPLIKLGVIVAVALIVSAPLVYSLVARYGLRIINTVPGGLTDEQISLANLSTFLTNSFLTQPIAYVAALGLMGLVAARARPGTRPIVLWWLGATVFT